MFVASEYFLIRKDGSFDDAVAAVGEEDVGFLNAAEGEAAGYQMGGVVNSAFGNQLHNLVAIAGIHAAGLKRQIFTIHPWQRQYLFFLIECANRDDGIRTGATPCEFKRIFTSGNLNHAVGPSTLCQ